MGNEKEIILFYKNFTKIKLFSNTNNFIRLGNLFMRGAHSWEEYTFLQTITILKYTHLHG